MTNLPVVFWKMLGLSGAEIEELLLLLSPGEEFPAEDAEYNEHLGLHEVADAYPEGTVEALAGDRSIRLPRGVPRSAIAALAGRLRLLLRARDTLAALAERCDRAGRAVAAVLDELAMNAAAQLHAAVLPEETLSRFRPLLVYHERRCARRGGVLRMRAAREASIGRLPVRRG